MKKNLETKFAKLTTFKLIINRGKTECCYSYPNHKGSYSINYYRYVETIFDKCISIDKKESCDLIIRYIYKNKIKIKSMRLPAIFSIEKQTDDGYEKLLL